MNKFLLFSDFKNNEINAILNHLNASLIINKQDVFSYDLIDSKTSISDIFNHDFILMVCEKEIDTNLISFLKTIEKDKGLPKLIIIYKNINLKKDFDSCLYLNYKNEDELKALIIKVILNSYYKIKGLINKIKKSNAILSFNEKNVFSSLDSKTKLEVNKLIKKYTTNYLFISELKYLDQMIKDSLSFDKNEYLSIKEIDKKEYIQLQNSYHKLAKYVDNMVKNKKILKNNMQDILKELEKKRELLLSLFKINKVYYSSYISRNEYFIESYKYKLKMSQNNEYLSTTLLYLNYFYRVNKNKYFEFSFRYFEYAIQYLDEDEIDYENCLSLLLKCINDEDFEAFIKKEEFNLYIFPMFTLVSYIYYKINEFDKSNYYLNRAKSFSILNKGDIALYSALYEASVIVRTFDQSISNTFLKLYFEFYDQIDMEKDFHRVAVAYSEMGLYELSCYNFDKANECFNKTEKILLENYINDKDKLNDVLIAANFVNFAKVYDAKEDFKNAEKHIDIALEKFIKAININIEFATITLYKDFDFISKFFKKIKKKEKYAKIKKLKSTLLKMIFSEEDDKENVLVN